MVRYLWSPPPYCSDRLLRMMPVPAEFASGRQPRPACLSLNSVGASLNYGRTAYIPVREGSKIQGEARSCAVGAVCGYPFYRNRV